MNTEPNLWEIVGQIALLGACALVLDKLCKLHACQGKANAPAKPFKPTKLRLL